MPGIVGLVTKAPGARAQDQLKAMVAELRHDPSHVSGMTCSERLGVYTGWTARAGSYAGQMPVYNQTRDRRLVFAGEEFSEGSCADQLIELYENDPEFPRTLNGRFQGIVIDEKWGTALLFNDRFGLHRIYYAETEESFYFASEAKALLAVLPELRSLDLKSLGEWISCGCVLENRSLFRRIHLLPAGSAWKFANRSLSQRSTYFQPSEWENQERLSGEDYYQELKGIFSKVLPRYFSGNQSIGMSLTGGLDTRMIMSWQPLGPGALKCYSFGGSYRDCKDVALARRIAKICEQPYEVIPVNGTFLSEFARYAEQAVYLTDGCVGVSRACDLFVNERAAKIAPVRMTGNYGSEVLRRLRAFKPVNATAGLFTPEIEAEVKKAGQTYAAQINRNALSFIAFCQLPWHHFGNLALEETQITMRSPFVDNELVRTVFRAPDNGVAKTDIFEDSGDCIRLIRDGDVRLKDIPTDRGLNGGGALSRAWLEFTFKAEYAYDYGMPQWLARTDHVLSPLHLEKLFLGHHKFAHFRVWYRDSLADYVRDMLLDSRSLTRPYINRKKVEEIVSGHLNGRQNFTTEIHRLLSLEYVNRLFIDSRKGAVEQSATRDAALC